MHLKMLCVKFQPCFPSLNVLSLVWSLIHFPQVPHIYFSEIGSGNELSPVWHQAITWTNADLLSIRPLVMNFSEIWIKTQNFSFIKMHLKMLSAKWLPFCPGGMIWYLWGALKNASQKISNYINSLTPGRCGNNVMDQVYEYCNCISLSDEYHRTPLMIK